MYSEEASRTTILTVKSHVVLLCALNRAPIVSTACNAEAPVRLARQLRI